METAEEKAQPYKDTEYFLMKQTSENIETIKETKNFEESWVTKNRGDK